MILKQKYYFRELDGRSPNDARFYRYLIGGIGSIGREGARETHVRARLSSTPLCKRLNLIITRWFGLIQIAVNPYRPELHYMRGPGPKWYAKYQGRTENGPL